MTDRKFLVSFAFTAKDNLCTFRKFMQNYKVNAYVISMEFSAVNRRSPSREMPLGSEEERLFSQLLKNIFEVL